MQKLPDDILSNILKYCDIDTCLDLKRTKDADTYFFRPLSARKKILFNHNAFETYNVKHIEFLRDIEAIDGKQWWHVCQQGRYDLVKFLHTIDVKGCRASAMNQIRSFKHSQIFT